MKHRSLRKTAWELRLKIIRSISFPSISTGAYGYSVNEAASTALETVTTFAGKNSGLKEVCFVLYDERTHRFYAEVLKKITGKK